MTMKSKRLEKKLESERIPIDLPIKRFSLLSHLDNITYAIEQLKAYSSGNYVIGYFMMRCFGTKETLHQLVPQEVAETIKKEDKNFDYVTIDKLLTRKGEIEAGRYKLKEGLIIGLDPCYSH